MMPLQDQLRLAMTLQAGTQGQIARAAGLPASTVCRVYNEKMKPSLAATAAIAEALGMRLVFVRPGQKNQAPCGHKVGVPDPPRYEASCKQCEARYEWVLVEVEG